MTKKKEDKPVFVTPIERPNTGENQNEPVFVTPIERPNGQEGDIKTPLKPGISEIHGLAPARFPRPEVEGQTGDIKTPLRPGISEIHGLAPARFPRPEVEGQTGEQVNVLPPGGGFKVAGEGRETFEGPLRPIARSQSQSDLSKLTKPTKTTIKRSQSFTR